MSETPKDLKETTVAEPAKVTPAPDPGHADLSDEELGKINGGMANEVAPGRRPSPVAGLL